MNHTTPSADDTPTVCQRDQSLSDTDTRAERTEASLVRWRGVAAKRRARWVKEQARLAAERRTWWAMVRRRLVGVSAAVVATTLLVAGWIGSIAPAEAVVAVAPTPVFEKMAVLESEVLESEVPAAVVAPAPAVPVRAGSVSQRHSPTYTWVSLELETPDPAWLRWRDAIGNVALEDMKCFRATEEGHRCRAGRRHTRIAKAVAAGAAPGLWTIEVCTQNGCTEVSAFETGNTLAPRS